MFRKLIWFAITSGLVKKIFDRYQGQRSPAAKIRPGKLPEASSPWSSGRQG